MLKSKLCLFHLKTLCVGISEIAREGEMAEFLSLICPLGCVVKYGAGWYSSSDTCDAALKWKEVNKLLVHLFAVGVHYEKKLALERRAKHMKSVEVQATCLSESE
jgi:hypothetical protein